MLVSFPIVELIDRLVISKIKLEKSNINQAEFDYYNTQANKFDLTKINSQLLELEQIHNSIWNLESDLKNGVEYQHSLEEIGRRAIDIRDLNNQRIKLKNEMAELLGCSVREIKKDHLSE